jgi:phytoene dehydrogenase-like protein
MVPAIDTARHSLYQSRAMRQSVLTAGKESGRATARVSPDQLRELLHRRTIAGDRYRARVARLLGMNDTEAAALAHLAHHGQLTPGELGRLVGLTSGGTTALIHRLLTRATSHGIHIRATSAAAC